MSLKFPISLVGKRGGVDLKEGLVDWWEGSSSIGKHAGNDIGSLGTQLATQPATFDASWNWTVNKANFFAGFGCSFYANAGKQTLGFVIRKASYGVNTYIVNAGYVGACRFAYNNGGNLCQTSYFNYSSTGSRKSLPLGDWLLVLYQWDPSDRTGQTFFNNQLVVYPNSPDQGNGPIYRIGYNYGASIEVAQIIYWNRWMTQEDADLLYSEGNYLNYSSI